MNFFTHPIPVKPFVFQYLKNGNKVQGYVWQALYAMLDKSSPDVTRRKNQPLVDGSITIEETALVKKGKSELKLSDYTEQYKFKLPEYIFKSNGFALTKSNIIKFNNVIEDYIRDRFECEMNANIRRSEREGRSFNLKELMIDLCGEFNMGEEHLPYETIRKHLYRVRAAKGIKLMGIKSYPKNVPQILSNPVNPTYMRQELFWRKYKISEKTFYRRKNEGLFEVKKVGGACFVRTDNLPAHIVNVTTSRAIPRK